MANRLYSIYLCITKQPNFFQPNFTAYPPQCQPLIFSIFQAGIFGILFYHNYDNSMIPVCICNGLLEICAVVDIMAVIRRLVVVCATPHLQPPPGRSSKNHPLSSRLVGNMLIMYLIYRYCEKSPFPTSFSTKSPKPLCRNGLSSVELLPGRLLCTPWEYITRWIIVGITKPPNTPNNYNNQAILNNVTIPTSITFPTTNVIPAITILAANLPTLLLVSKIYLLSIYAISKGKDS